MEKPKLGDFVDVNNCGSTLEKCQVIVIYHKDQTDMQFFIITDGTGTGTESPFKGSPLKGSRLDDFTLDPDDYLLHKDAYSFIGKCVKWFHISDILNIHYDSSASTSIKYPNGCNCRDCNEHYPFAEPNQPDGTLLCYSCRGRG